MTSTVQAMNPFVALAPVRVVAASDQSGTYFNGPINNGVGATLTYATGALTIDSVVVNLNDYVLLAGQTAGYENGIYQCTQMGATGVSAILTRRGDLQCIEQIQAGAYVSVFAGTVYGGSMWAIIEPLPAAIGVPLTSGLNDINFATITATGSSLYLEKANNLSDVVSASASRTSLGLGSGDSPTFTNLTLTGFYNFSVANALTAHVGGGQGSALALAKGINRVTTVASGGDSVKLPAATAGRALVVINAAASNAMDCFPASGDAINALAADTALSIAADSTVMFFCAVAGTWDSIVTA
jgi:hypothetical protein